MHAKLRVPLRHLAVQALARESHRNRAHIQLQLDGLAFGCLGRCKPEHAGRSQRGMPGKVQLFLGGKDAHPHAIVALRLHRPALDKCGLGKIEFARDRLHAPGGQPRGVHHHCQRVPGQRSARKNVNDKVLEFSGGS